MTQDTNKLSLSERLATARREIAVALKLGRVYQFAKDGESVALVESDPVANHSWTDIETQTKVEPIDVRLGRGKTDTIKLYPGVTVIMGKAGSGKTLTAYDHIFRSLIAKYGKDFAHYTKIFEPGESERFDAGSTSEPVFEAEFAATLAHHLLNTTTRVYIVDSFRYLFYGSGTGATGKGGVNMSLFMDLTHLDTVARKFGKSIVVLVNPMTDDDTAFDFYIEAAVGAVSSVLIMKSYDEAKFSSRDSGNRSFFNIKISEPQLTKRGATDTIKAQREPNASSDKVSNLFDRNTRK